MRNVEVMHRPRPRKRVGVPLLDPEQIRREVSPLANLLPSQSARDGEVIVPHKRRPGFAELRTRANFADAIRQAWTEAEENFAAIGRYLNQAKAKLNHGEFMAMVESDLPFRYSTANRLMKVAAALDASVLPANRLPPSYATIYELLMLSEEERQQALDEGIVRPEMQRKDVVAFRKKLRQLSTDKRAKLEAERDRLKKRLGEIERELAGLTAGHGTSNQ